MTGSAWSAQKDLGLLWGKIKASSFSVLLVFVPLGLVAGIFQFNALFVFGLNLVALIPMALLLGDVTEDLAEHYGDVVGGLLNATFGNVGTSY
jgi:Ca2+:H+ antiporter